MSDTVDTVSTAERNTKERLRSFFFTWNNPPEDAEALLAQHLEKKHYQPEIGKNGTKHLQGYGMFKNPRAFNAIIKLFPGIHIEKIKNYKATIQYCMKEDTKAGPLVSDIIKPKIKDPLDGVSLYPFQSAILDAVKLPPDSRTINWYWDSKGNSGKTSLGKSLAIRYPNEVLYLSGKCADVKYGVAQFISNPKNNFRIAIFNLTRTIEDYVSYAALEEVKDGIFFSTKYESGMVLFDVPHIYVFANFPPDVNKMSKDRWNIVEINNTTHTVISDEWDDIEGYDTEPDENELKDNIMLRNLLDSI